MVFLLVVSGLRTWCVCVCMCELLKLAIRRLGEMSWEGPGHVSNGAFVSHGRPHGVRVRAYVFRSYPNHDVANVSFVLVAVVVATARRRVLRPYVFHPNACVWHLCVVKKGPMARVDNRDRPVR